jgi:hypothetical protein
MPELSINLLIVIVLAVLVLVVLIVFVFSSWMPGLQAIDLQNATSNGCQTFLLRQCSGDGHDIDVNYKGTTNLKDLCQTYYGTDCNVTCHC